MKTRILFLLGSLLIICSSHAQPPTTVCKVLDAYIAGSYSGGCKDGLAQGEGVAKGRDEYRGMFVDGKQHGKGVYTWSNGNKYEGDWVDGKQHGKGVHTWSNGNKYEGDWVGGKRHGKGVSTKSNGQEDKGDWVDDKFVDLIENAWTCDPVINIEIKNWRLRQPKADGQIESAEEGMARFSKSLLEFRKCPDQPNDKEMRDAFISKYTYFSLQTCCLNTSYAELKQRAAKEDDVNIQYVNLRSDYREDKGRIERIASQEEGRKRAALQATEDEARHANLKSGKAKIASMKDATMLVDAGSVFSLAGNPLLTPDNKNYKGDVKIDAQENTLIRVQSELMGIQERRNPRYVYLKLSKKTVNFAPNSMRIGATISVIGKYVKNVNYRTVGGETKTAPVIECSYLGEPTGEEAASALKQMIQLRESMSK